MKLMTVELACEDGVDLARWTATGETSAAEAFDRLVPLLAQARAELAPGVPDRLPLIIKPPPQVTGPGWQWAIEADGTLVLNLRHPGSAGSVSAYPRPIGSAKTCSTCSTSGARCSTKRCRRRLPPDQQTGRSPEIPTARRPCQPSQQRREILDAIRFFTIPSRCHVPCTTMSRAPSSSWRCTSRRLALEPQPVPGRQARLRQVGARGAHRVAVTVARDAADGIPVAVDVEHRLRQRP